MRLLEFIPVETCEEGFDVVEEFIDPGKVEEGLVDGLGSPLAFPLAFMLL